MKGTYNDFKQWGKVVENPPVVVWLEDHPDSKYGMFRCDITPIMATEYLFMRVKGVTLSDTKSAVRAAEPVLVTDIEGERSRWDGLTGDRLSEPS
jgi:hypothetical protein